MFMERDRRGSARPEKLYRSNDMAEFYKVMDWDEINVSASVGAGGVNSKDDVIVVQAMLKYGLKARSYFLGEKFPEPNGTMDPATMELIRKYQQYLRRKLKVPVSVDGRIDPANGSAAFGKKGKWTIQMLNADVMEMWLIVNGGHGNHLEDLCRRFPQASSAIGGEVPVGTLSLKLEPVEPLVGSLNLRLE
jgi:hypothetical protein